MFSMEDGGQGEVVGTSDKDWKEEKGLAEAKEAIRNIQVLTMMIRNYDYGKSLNPIIASP